MLNVHNPTELTETPSPESKGMRSNLADRSPGSRGGRVACGHGGGGGLALSCQTVASQPGNDLDVQGAALAEPSPVRLGSGSWSSLRPLTVEPSGPVRVCTWVPEALAARAAVVLALSVHHVTLVQTCFSCSWLALMFRSSL